MKEKVSQIVWRVFIACASFTLLLTIVLCTRGYISLPWVIKKPFCLFGILFVMGLMLYRMDFFLDKYGKILLPLFLCLYGITIYVLGIMSRGTSMLDSQCVYQGALYMAGLSNEISWEYFARCNNNIIPMLYLGFLFRVASGLGIKEPWYFAVAVNTVYVLIALYCVFRLGRRRKSNKAASAWLSMLMLSAYMPILGHTQSMYTDAFSFCYGIGAFCLWLHNQESGKTGVKYQFGNILAGIVWALGVQMKATVVISLVAVVCYQILFGAFKEFLRKCLVVIIVVVAAAIACTAYIKTLPIKEYEDQWNIPVVGNVIALGLEGEGNYTMESEYVNAILTITGRENKWNFIKNYIWEHRANFFDKDHIVAKLRYNFTSGVMGASDFLWEVEREGLVYHCLSAEGKHCWSCRIWINCYWYLTLGIAFIAWLSRVFLVKGKEDIEVFVSILSMFGIMLYVMLGEANSRYLYNQLPWIFFVASMGMCVLLDAFRKGIDAIVSRCGKIITK